MVELVVRGAQAWVDGGWVLRDVFFRAGVIVDDGPAGDALVIDGAGMLVAPGFIDLQCNGAMGIDLVSAPEQLWALAALLPRWGVTAWLPTLVTCPAEVVDRALATLASGPPPGWVGAVPLGLHLEGPFLAPARRGAHRADLLVAPDVDEIQGWTRDAGVAVVTLAPELPGAIAVVETLAAHGVVVSLGHTDASLAEATAAVDAGARGVTHLFNAMVPMHHRAPGLPTVALMDDRLHVGLIVDGVHVHPAAVALAHRVLGARLILVTDAVSGLGLPAGAHELGGRTIWVGDDGVRSFDGTLAGANLSMDRAVRNLMVFAGCPPEAALHAATAAPANLLGDRSRASLAPGSRADVVLLTEYLQVAVTIVGGSVVHECR